jgi:hypothetical protein
MSRCPEKFGYGCQIPGFLEVIKLRDFWQYTATFGRSHGDRRPAAAQPSAGHWQAAAREAEQGV